MVQEAQEAQEVQEAQWFQVGSEGEKKAQKIAEEQEAARGPSRFWLKPGKSAKLTFLDTMGFYLTEHNLQIGGKFFNFFTCRADFSECPLCEAGHGKSYVAIYTVIDHSTFVSKKTGKEYKNTKKLLVAKKAVQTKLARRRESLDGDLTHAVFSFSRDASKECSTGEDIEVIKRLTKEDVLSFKPAGMSDEDWLAPFDYRELFAPKSVEELRRLVGQAAPVGSNDSAGGDAHPFSIGADVTTLGENQAIEALL